MRWVLSLALALLIGLGTLYGLTDGFTALTAEAARRQAVARHPRAVPDALLADEAGRTVSLRTDLRDDGRVAIVNFFYTRCMALCLAQGALGERLQQAIVDRGLQQRVRLISISFDLRDRAPALARYAQRMDAVGSIWQFMAFTGQAQRDELLRRFGITVVPAPLGEFEHNAAFHVVTPDGRLQRILDLDESGEALAVAAQLTAAAREAAAKPPMVHGTAGSAAAVHGAAEGLVPGSPP